MTPVEITQGKSFKGLATYLLHDQDKAQTAERVGWVQSFNLNDADGEQAWRYMLATANSANALKEAAGIKKGKTPVKVVHHYSINFNPEDDVTPEIMAQAVAESLEVYDMAHHQALAVEHVDTKHRHVHVMVNLIDPTNGMSAASPQKIAGTDKKRSKLSNSQRKLSTWAQKFERDNGLTFTEGRVSNANKRQRGEKVDARRKSRKTYEREKREQTTDRRRDFLKRQHNDRAKQIQADTVELKEQSRLEWDALKESYTSQKAALKAEKETAIHARKEEIKTLFKPYWRDMYQRQRKEVQAFEAGDKTAIGKIWHGVAAFRDRALDGDYLGGFVAAFSHENRRNIVLRKHDHESEEMRQRLYAQIKLETGKMRADFARQSSHARDTFLGACDQLKASQDMSWSEIKAAWRDYNQNRTAAFSQAKTRQANINRAQYQERGRGREPS